MIRIRFPVVASCAAILAAGACYHPPAAKPAPQVAPVVDNSAADARARAEAARRDSIARAEAAQRDAAARAEADRRARDAAESARSAITARIFFDFDHDELSPEAIATLAAKVPVLQAHPDVHLRIEGNADDRGSDEYNLALGQRRAAAARRYLASRGISEARLEVVSFGEERPACKDEAEPCWHQNRRDEFEILSGTLPGGASRP